MTFEATPEIKALPFYSIIRAYMLEYAAYLAVYALIPE